MQYFNLGVFETWWQDKIYPQLESLIWQNDILPFLVLLLHFMDADSVKEKTTVGRKAFYPQCTFEAPSMHGK